MARGFLRRISGSLFAQIIHMDVAATSKGRQEVTDSAMPLEAGRPNVRFGSKAVTQGAEHAEGAECPLSAKSGHSTGKTRKRCVRRYAELFIAPRVSPTMMGEPKHLHASLSSLEALA